MDKVDSVKNLLGLPENRKLCTAFTMVEGEMNYGSPVFVDSTYFHESDQEQYDKRPKYGQKQSNKMFSFTPLNYGTISNCGNGTVCRLLKAPINRRVLKLWEPDSMLNHVRIIDIDSISEYNYTQNPNNFFNKVMEKGMVVLRPNNLKAVTELVTLTKAIVEEYKVSLLHKFSYAIGENTIKKNDSVEKELFFKSALAYSKLTSAHITLIGVDIKYCLPLYNYHSQKGIFILWRYTVLHEDNYPTDTFNHCLDFAVFVSNSKENLYVLDGETLFPAYSQYVKSSMFDDLLLKLQTTYPFNQKILNEDQQDPIVQYTNNGLRKKDITVVMRKLSNRFKKKQYYRQPVLDEAIREQPMPDEAIREQPKSVQQPQYDTITIPALDDGNMDLGKITTATTNELKIKLVVQKNPDYKIKNRP